MPRIRKAERRDAQRAKRHRRLKGYSRSSMPAIRKDDSKGSTDDSKKA